MKSIKTVRAMKVAICDDQKEFVGEMQNHLEEYFASKGVKADFYLYNDGSDLLVEHIEFDVIILDIKMKLVSGFRVRDYLTKEHSQAKIIYLTDYPELLGSSFGENVVGFTGKDEKEDVDYYLDSVVHDYKLHKFIKLDNKVIDLYHIAYIKGNGRFTEFYDDTGKMQWYKISIAKLERQMKRDGLYEMQRIHPIYMINFRCLEQLEDDYVCIRKAPEFDSITLPVEGYYKYSVRRAYVRYIKEKYEHE